MKWVLRAIPYLFVLLFVFVQPSLDRFDANALYAHGSSTPNDVTGEVWRIVFRDGTSKYISLDDYVWYYAPFLIVPCFILAIVWIILDLWKAGVFGGDKS